MAGPPPIQQRIDVVADTKGADEVSRAMGELEKRNRAEAEQVDRATKAAKRKATQLDRLSDELRSLTAKEIEHERRVKSGVAADTEATQASQQRQLRVERLTRAVALGEDRQEELNRRVRESVDTHRAATSGVEETGEATDRAGIAVKGLKSAFGSLGIGLTASGGVLLALRLVKAELENIKQLQQEAFQEQVTLASAQRQLKRNLVDASDEDIEAAIEGANKVAADQNVPNEVVTLALADALSSTGGDVDLALRNVSLAAQVIPDQPDQIPVFSGGLGDIQGALGTDDPEVALGFLLKATGQSRITDFSRASTNIPPAIQAAIAQGFSPAEAASLFSNITTGTSDRTGESSRTAVIQLAGELSRFFEERGLEERGGAAIARLQQDEALRGEFEDSVSIETRARATVTSLLTPGTPEAQAFIDRQAPFGNESELEAAALDKIRQLESGSLEQTARINRVLQSTTEQLQADNEGFGRVGAVQEELAELLRSTGSSALGNKIGAIQFDVASVRSADGAFAVLDDLLEKRLVEILENAGDSSTPVVIGARSLEGTGVSPAQFAVEGQRAFLTDEQRAAVEAITSALDEITELRGQGSTNVPGVRLESFESKERSSLGGFRRGLRGDDLRELERLEEGPNAGTGLGAGAARSPGTDAGSFLGGGLINHGTIFINGGDPLIDDLDGRDRLA